MRQQQAAMIATMVDYQERLVGAMRAQGVSVQQLADHLGVSYQAVAKVRSGLTKSFSAQNNDRAAQLLKVSASWLANGSGPMAAAPGAPASPGSALAARDPAETFRQTTWAELPATDLTQPFQMQIPGDELAPFADRGDIGRFKPGGAPRPGHPIVIRDAEGRFYLRLYREGIGTAWEGYSERPGFKTLDSVEHGVTIVAPMTGRDWA